jgi:hypothetical protein
MKVTVKQVLRELRNARRRKGGFRRMRMDVLLNRAWALAWDDDFREDAIEYVARAEASLLSQEKAARSRSEQPRPD